MGEYRVQFSIGARQDFEDIYHNSQSRWSFEQTDAYVIEIEKRCFGLSHMPQRVGFDLHTRNEKTFRSFAYKAHKVFFTIDEATKTVNIVAVLPSRTKYSAKL